MAVSSWATLDILDEVDGTIELPLMLTFLISPEVKRFFEEMEEIEFRCSN